MKDSEGVFLPLISDDREALAELMKAQQSDDALQTLKERAMVTGNVGMVTVAQTDVPLDKARVAPARVVHTSLSHGACMQVQQVWDAVVQCTFEAQDQCLEAVQGAWVATHTTLAFLDSVRDAKDIRLHKPHNKNNNT